MNAVASSSLETSKKLFNKEAFFEKLKQDKIIFESFLPPGSSCKSATIAELREAQAKIRIQIPDFFPQAEDYVQVFPAKKIKPPMRQWSLERKQANRLKKLEGRLKRKFTIPLLYQEALQEELGRKPWYYGVCQIAGTECSCPDYGMLLRQKRAIERENECRANGE